MPSKPKVHKPSRKARRTRQPDTRASAARRGYDRKWRERRRLKLQRNPLCEQCEAKGMTEPAIDVDHIRPLSDGGTSDWGNLQSLCRTCHNRKTARQRGRAGSISGAGPA